MRLVKKRKERLSEEDTKLFFEELRAAQKADKQFFAEARKMKDLLKGDPMAHLDPVTQKSPEAKIITNLVHSYVRTTLPTIFFQNPTVKAYPRRPLDNGREDTWNLVANNTLARNGYKQETKKVIQDAIVYQEGWKKVFYQGPPDDEQPDEGGGAGAVPTAETDRGPTPWGSRGIPVSVRIPAPNVVVDPLAPGRDLNQARYVAIKYIRPLSEIEENPIYDVPESFDRTKLDQLNTSWVARDADRLDVTEDSDMQVDNRSRGARGIDLVTIWEVWCYQHVDLKLYKQVFTLMEGAKVPIRQPVGWEQVVGIEFPGWPVHKIELNPVNDDNPVPEIRQWYELQQAINWLIGKLVSFASLNNKRYLINPNKLKDLKAARASLMSGKTIEIIETNIDGNENIRTAVDQLENQPVEQAHYDLVSLLIQFIERVSNSGANQQGVAQNVRTATEASIVEQNQDIRQAERVDTVREFLKADIEKLVAVIKNTATNEFVFRMAGDTGAIEWERFNPSDIQWQPDIEIVVDSFRNQEMQQEMAKYIQLINLSAQLVPVLGPQLRLDVLYKDFLKAARVPNPEEILGNYIGAREKQLIEIMMLARGADIQPKQGEAHEMEISAINEFLNSPAAQLYSQEELMPVLIHLQGHEELLKQGRNGSPVQALGQNPGDQVGREDEIFANSVLSEANVGRQIGASVREASRTGPQQGNAGGF